MCRWRMGYLVMQVGVIGLSEGNGHPFSFSAIINGYDIGAFKNASWPVIFDYLETQPKELFGFDDVCVTHAWTQYPDVTRKLCAACKIENAVSCPKEMLGEIDILIIARDDWETHLTLALPFLEQGVRVFIDKPLSLNEEELAVFKPFLVAGTLMTTSGLRYAYELDELRSKIPSLGNIRYISAVVVNDIERYGIHMLDAANALGFTDAIKILRMPAEHGAFSITFKDNLTMDLHCLGSVSKTFHLSVYGDNGHAHVDLHDNFMAFKNTLSKFFEMCKSGIPQIPPDQVIRTMQLINTAKKLDPSEATFLNL